MTLSPDARRHFLAAVDLFDSRVRATPADAWALPSPCEGWTARDVLVHNVVNLQALGESAAGGDFFSSFGRPIEGDAVEAWAEVSAGAAFLLERAARAPSLVVGGNQVPPAVIIEGLMRDLVIHTWDLARSVGGDEKLPEDLVAAAMAAMAGVGPESRRPGFYGEEVPAPPGADALTRLLALSGRKVG